MCVAGALQELAAWLNSCVHVCMCVAGALQELAAWLNSPSSGLSQVLYYFIFSDYCYFIVIIILLLFFEFLSLLSFLL
jgi:hypothetical protein